MPNYDFPEMEHDGTYKITKEWYRNSYLKSDKWKKIKEFRTAADNKRCAVCGSTNRLCVHHKNYESLKRCGYDDDTENLVTLCDRCHSDIHTYGESIYHCSYMYRTKFIDSIVNNTIAGSAQSAAAPLLDFANRAAGGNALIAITDMYVFSRAKEFSTEGDLYMLTHGNNKRIGIYLDALFEWNPIYNVENLWGEIVGLPPGMCGISPGRYMGFYKAIKSRRERPWAEINWRPNPK